MECFHISYSAPALEQALRIINFLSQNDGAYGINELSRILDISNNMTFRILTQLTNYKYTSIDPAGKYRLGSKLYSIGIKLSERYNLKNCVHPRLTALCKATGEVTHIQVADGNRCMLTDSIAPDKDFYFYVKPGSRLFYHGNAFGKAMLAFMDKEKFNEATSDGLCRLTPKTATDPAVLEEMLAHTRLTGIAYDLEEYNSGIFCVGAPVFDVVGEVVAGIGIIGFVSSLENGDTSAYERPVLECAANISSDIGYDGGLFADWLKKRNK